MTDRKPVNIIPDEDFRSVTILDQSLLPGRTEYIKIDEPTQMYDAIYHLRVRGAPAIGIFAAYAMVVFAVSESASAVSCREFELKLEQHCKYLKSSRPTAVNLSWAADRMLRVAKDALSGTGDDGDSIRNAIDMMKAEAVAVHDEDRQMCRRISEFGLQLINNGDGILTHCNAGPLATSEYGTALGPILLGTEKGMDFHVFADETRPLLQGARLTAYELSKAGVNVTLICDNMASIVMRNGWVDACFVGCDRVAANGDTANKIGTSGVAVLAKYYGIPFYVLGPTSTIDLDCPSGSEIPIEERPPEEIKDKFFSEPSSLPEVRCYNPAFDVTDNSLITAIVTENGICRPPFTESLRKAKSGEEIL